MREPAVSDRQLAAGGSLLPAATILDHGAIAGRRRDRCIDVGVLLEGPDRLPVVMRDVLTKSLTIRGFIQREFSDRRPAFYREMANWIESGRVKYREDIVEGLENAPQSLIGLLEGRNFGKLLIKVS